MKPHPRTPIIRKTIKWGGAAVTVLLVAVWVGSEWWCIEHAGTPLTVRLSAGSLQLQHQEFVWDPEPEGWNWYKRSKWEPWSWWIEQSAGGSSRTVLIPLWMLAAMILAPSFTAWRLDTLARRRERAHLCPKCGYDRTGLASADAKCPECGAVSAGV